MQNLTPRWSALVLAGLFTASSALAADKAASEKNDPAKMAEMMKKADAAGSPGEPHKALQSLVGEWQAEVKVYVSPDGPPIVSRGNSKKDWAPG